MPVLDEVLAQWKSLLHGDRFGAVCVFGNQKLAGAWKQSVQALEAKAQRPVTLGFGPRFLHSTGQLHKGGPAQGVFLQVIQVPDQTAEIPGRDFDFGTLMLAQAHGDANVLANAGLTVLSVTASTDQLPTLWEALES
jgi:glucose-6-phosphate isomerase